MVIYLGRLPNGRVSFGLQFIEKGEAWRYEGINFTSLYNCARAMGLCVKKVNDTAAIVWYP